MKRLSVIVMFVLSINYAQAQDFTFGVKAGLMATSYDNSVGGSSDTGFYAGGLVDFALTDKFRIEPAILFTALPDNKGLTVPVLVKYSFFEKFYAEAGPGINYSFDAKRDAFSPSFDLGASYDILENLFVDARADFGLSGYLSNNISVGAGYRF